MLDMGYLFAELALDFFADSLCNRHCCHSSGLSAAHSSVGRVSILVKILRELHSGKAKEFCRKAVVARLSFVGSSQQNHSFAHLG